MPIFSSCSAITTNDYVSVLISYILSRLKSYMSFHANNALSCIAYARLPFVSSVNKECLLHYRQSQTAQITTNLPQIRFRHHQLVTITAAQHNRAIPRITANREIIAVSSNSLLFSHHMLCSQKKKRASTRELTQAACTFLNYNSITSPTSIICPFLASNNSMNLCGSC